MKNFILRIPAILAFTVVSVFMPVIGLFGGDLRKNYKMWLIFYYKEIYWNTVIKGDYE